MAKKSEKIEQVSDVKALAKSLLLEKKNGHTRISDSELTKVQKFSDGYKRFLDASKTERESVNYSIEAAGAAGFIPFEFGKKYQAGDKVYWNNRGKAMCLAIIGKNGAKNGVKIAAAHIDCPRIDLKPIPLYESNEMAFLKTHYYGGIKKYQWTAIPLAMHGTIVCKDGKKIDVRIGEEACDPQFTITDILPHLGKDQAAKKLGEAFTGEDLNILVGSIPASKEKGDNLFKLNVMKLLNQQYGVVEQDLVSAEIEFVPAFRASDIGFDRSMIGAYGHDDRVCSYTALEALFKAKTPESTIITVLADKEEIGSMGNTGLGSDFLRFFITDLAETEGLKPHRVMMQSTCLSADVTAAYDPNFSYAYELNNSCLINHGIGVAKYTGSRGKSGSSDASAELVAKVRKIFDDNDVLWQVGELGKVDQGGGGTVAFEVAAMCADVIDVGVPVLSMHAPFEVVSKLDVFMTYKGILAYFEDKA